MEEADSDLQFVGGDSAGGANGNEEGLNLLMRSELEGKVGGDLPLSMGAGDDRSGGAAAGGSGAGGGFLGRIFTLDPLRKFFNVETDDVVSRLKDALLRPHGRDFLNKMNGVGPGPDIYGPFWLAATLVFVCTTFGNYARYMSSRAQGENAIQEWYFDVDKVTTTFSIFYGYFLAPVALHFYLIFSWKASVGLMRLVCLYGYALTAFVPISVICMIPSETVRWMSIIAGAVVSSTFLAMNLWAPLGELNPNSTAVSQLPVIAVSVLGWNAGLAALLKIFVFA